MRRKHPAQPPKSGMEAVLDAFDGLSIKEVLDADSRPTFVIDLDPDLPPKTAPTNAIAPVFCNAALKSHERLLDSILGNTNGIGTNDTHDDDDDDHDDHDDHDESSSSEANSSPKSVSTATRQQFRAWATGVTTHDDSRDVFPLSVSFHNLLWVGSTVRKRWRLISGNRQWMMEDRPPQDLSSGAPLEVATGGNGLMASLATKQPLGRKANSRKSRALTIDLDAASAESSPSVVGDDDHLSPIFYPRKSNSGGGSVLTGISKSSRNRSINLANLPERNAIDWTVPEPQGQLSAHLVHVRSKDWSGTSLGPMDKWTDEFRLLLNLVMSNPHPAALFWGSKLTVIYNEPYASDVAGNKHPTLMGSDFADFFAEIWEYCGPLFEECGRTGASVRKDNDFLNLNRQGMLEETYYSWQFIPMYSSSTRELLGFYNAPFQTTSMVLSQRRMKTVNAIGDHTGSAKTVKEFWKQLMQSLESNPRDIPFALLYSVGDDDDDGEYSSTASDLSISLKTCHLEGALGVPDGHPAAPRQLDLKRSLEGFVPSFREAMRTREPTLLRVRDGTLPESLLEGIEWRGFGDPCKDAIIFPVRPTNADAVLAFLVLGVNPRRPYDDEYKAFSTMVNRQLSTSLASTILFEEDARRMRDAFEAAHLEKEKLSQQLDLQASRLRRMTELSPLGMCLISPEGVLREANERFFEMTSLPRGSQYELSWMDFIMPRSLKTMEDGWQRLSNGHNPWSGELQLKTPQQRTSQPIDHHGQAIEYWVMFIAQPEIAADDTLRSVMVSITDISKTKWAQNLREHQLLEAEEQRRQQNEFIDITSHEMRNPLSAILQCADDIALTLVDSRKKGISPTRETIESCVESAQTISLCVQHQKAIVDDILTISKLDSNLLIITHVPSQPKQILSRALKMFESELQAKQIEAKLDMHPSYLESKVDWVQLDPSRVLQVLINLLTNAIKFTAPSKRRCVTVNVGASLKPPVLTHIPGFQFAPMSINKPMSVAGDWGEGEIVYIRFRVEDTGCGLTSEERQILFQRFKQASPRTHAQYGGSGLGLFISKRLAELHGGQIGVASKAGEGSIFAFYVQGRRCDPPSDALESEMLNPGRHQAGDKSIQPQLAPQRQIIASVGGNGAGLLAEKPAMASKFDPKKTSILVVEDNLINQRVLANQLNKVGCTVHLANDGLEALAFLKKTHFSKNAPSKGGGMPLDIVLMDLEMPNMDGLTCVKEIRKMEAAGEIVGHVPVIAVTANVRDQQMATARESGMDDVLSKPFRIVDLLKKLETMLFPSSISATYGY